MDDHHLTPCAECEQIRSGTFKWLDNEGIDHFAPIMQLLAEHGYSVMPIPRPTVERPPRPW